MPGEAFQFKHFSVRDDMCAMKVGTDGVLLGAWTETNNVKHILDVGTGSGLIALMLAQKCDASIDAIDVDNDAVLQAKENLAQSNWNDRIQIYKQALQNFDSEGKKYDLIVSNPPFYSDSSSPQNHARTLARHSDQSLSHEDLLKNVKRLLSSSGKFCVILPSKEGVAILKLAPLYELYCNRITKVKTKQNKKPKRVLLEFGHLMTETKTDELVVLREDEKYSDDYIALTKDYYMQLAKT
ncbi:MAG: methyltransferase [Bacteroidia bacterium]|nr:methyltransferase [Bacteroidia bacterium]NNC86681.1 methyltransferase [Bacteroidia bacterium]NNM16901.1 methyltransferase [Bacteroidia bacterium]